MLPRVNHMKLLFYFLRNFILIYVPTKSVGRSGHSFKWYWAGSILSPRKDTFNPRILSQEHFQSLRNLSVGLRAWWQRGGLTADMQLVCLLCSCVSEVTPSLSSCAPPASLERWWQGGQCLWASEEVSNMTSQARPSLLGQTFVMLTCILGTGLQNGVKLRE